MENKTRSVRGVSGQALIETLLWLPISVMVASGATQVLKNQWQHARCAYRAFALTRAHLHGRPLRLNSSEVVSDEPQYVTGRFSCGNTIETIRLEKL